MTFSEAGPERSSTATATSLTAGSMMAMNVLVYAFTLAASHLLGPEHFGGVSAFLGVPPPPAGLPPARPRIATRSPTT
jgi:hypothetical protein